MGLRGPRPEPMQMQRMKGFSNNRRKGEPEGPAAIGDAFASTHLRDDAKACIEVIKASMPPGLYARADSFLLAAFATAWSLHKEAVEKLNEVDKNGRRMNRAVIMNAAGSKVPSPWVKIASDQARLLASLGDRLGLDPKSRAALKAPNDDQPESKFSGLLGGRPN